MNREEATKQVLDLLADQYYHQADKPHLEVDREDLAGLIVKQMEHAYFLGKQSVTLESLQKKNDEVYKSEMQ